MKRNIYGVALSTIGPLAAALMFAGCGGEKSERSDSVHAEETFEHADRDIAMTLGSIVDAVSVGEALDSTVYNYVGLLTDGEGYNLYWDEEGYPGQWEVLVVSPDSAVIRNLKSGDLRVSALQEYICENLALTDSDVCASADPDNDDVIEKSVYAFSGGRLTFELLEDDTPLGEAGPFLNISIAR